VTPCNLDLATVSIYKLHYVLSLNEVSMEGLTRVSCSTFPFDSVAQKSNEIPASETFAKKIPDSKERYYFIF
jgi:hypothetical protein